MKYLTKLDEKLNRFEFNGIIDFIEHEETLYEHLLDYVLKDLDSVFKSFKMLLVHEIKFEEAKHHFENKVSNIVVEGVAIYGNFLQVIHPIEIVFKNDNRKYMENLLQFNKTNPNHMLNSLYDTVGDLMLDISVTYFRNKSSIFHILDEKGFTEQLELDDFNTMLNTTFDRSLFLGFISREDYGKGLTSSLPNKLTQKFLRYEFAKEVVLGKLEKDVQNSDKSKKIEEHIRRYRNSTFGVEMGKTWEKKYNKGAVSYEVDLTKKGKPIKIFFIYTYAVIQHKNSVTILSLSDLSINQFVFSLASAVLEISKINKDDLLKELVYIYDLRKKK